jgi:hypothetical protein
MLVSEGGKQGIRKWTYFCYNYPQRHLQIQNQKGENYETNF